MPLINKERKKVSLDESKLPLIKVVGISASGKSTLVKSLRNAGYNARPVSQEHSNIHDLWQQFDRPALLIYLDIKLEAQRQRRPDVTWDAHYLQTERLRLAHARDHADLKLDTSAMTPEIVWRLVHVFVKQQRIRHAEQPLSLLTATGSAVQPVQLPPETERLDTKQRRKKRNRR